MSNKPNKFRIAFLGTPLFAVNILEKMKEGGLTPSLVITSKDKPKGRKLILTPPPVKEWADKENIPALQPVKLNDIYAKLKKEDWDIFVLASFGKIIPKEIIEIPKYGVLNVHPSVLPSYRGASPIQSAMLSGDKDFGVTIMLLDEELDHGPILAVSHSPPLSDINHEELEDRLAELGGELLVKTMPSWIEGKIKAVPQDHGQATYTEKIKKEDALIDWKEGVETIERKIRAYYPWPGAYFLLNKDNKPFRIIVTKASLVDGKLKIERVKPEGKKEMLFSDFIKGNPDLRSQIPDYVI